MEVPCGNCRACCTSSYFIHIKPDETETLSKIPKELQFPAPGLASGNVLLGYDQNGHCPMFVDNECSIYEYRPQTCRDYDCRIFPATGLLEGKEKQRVVDQSKRWQFEFRASQDHEHISALKRAAQFLVEYSQFFPAGFVPTNPTQQSVLAIKIYEVFLIDSNKSFNTKSNQQIREVVDSVIATYKMFLKKEKS